MNRQLSRLFLVGITLVLACPVLPGVYKGSGIIYAVSESQGVFFVNDDAPSDPGPLNPLISDQLENGSVSHPYDTIQEAIDIALENDCIYVMPGLYQEDISIINKSLRLIGVNDDYPVIKGTGNGSAVSFVCLKSECQLSGFVITGGRDIIASAVFSYNSKPVIKNCLIVNNRVIDSTGNGAVIAGINSNIKLVNCTVSDNHGELSGGVISLFNSGLELSNSIIWDNSPGTILFWGSSNASLKYCNICDDCLKYAPANTVLKDNTHTDPLFSEFNLCFDDIETHSNEPDGISYTHLIEKYRLKSQGGHWCSETGSWVLDDQTSPCIDTGDPLAPVAEEPVPHGKIINMGAFGGTKRASKSSINLFSPVVFKDAVLKRCIEDELWISDPTPQDMLELTSLQCINKDINNLDGLQWAKNLQSLWIRFCHVSDISVLLGLDSLKYLNLSQNNIKDITPLSGLKNLLYLNLHGNQINDITCLSSLTKMQFLELRKNPVKSIDALSNLTSLTHLNLNELYPPLSDLSPLEKLVNIVHLELNSNKISDISVIFNFTDLAYLDLSSNELHDIGSLVGLKNLKTLDLRSNSLDDWSCSSALDEIKNNNPDITLLYDQHE